MKQKMPRTRKPQTPSVQWRGRVANTTTSSLPQVYRFGNNVSDRCCKDVQVTVAWIRPVHVNQWEPGHYTVYINEAELRGIIERYENLDLSRVNLTLGTLQGPITVSGDLNVENWTLTASSAELENVQIEEGTVATLTVETASIANATITEENVTTSTIDTANITTWNIETGNVTTAVIGTETVTESTIENATITSEDVTNSIIETANITTANIETENTATANIDKAVIEDSEVKKEKITESFTVNPEASATFKGTNTFESDATFNEDITVGWDSNLHNLKVDNVTTLEWQLNANANAAFDKNVSVAWNTTLNTVNTNGYATFNDRTTFNEDTVFNDTLTAANNATFNGQTNLNTITVGGQATFNDDADFDKNINVDWNAVVEWNARVDWSFSAGKESEFKSHLSVLGKLTANNEEVIWKTTTNALEVNTRAVIANEEVENSTIRNLTVTDSFVLPEGALDQYQAKSEKDQPNGYAGLDSNGKIVMSELPDEVTSGMHYKGTWEPTSDYPSNPKQWDLYKVSAEWEKGWIHFSVGDTIIYNGSSWDRIPSADDVSSVNGRKGDVVWLEETSNKVEVLDKVNPSRVKYASEYAVVNAIGAVESRIAGDEADIVALQNALDLKADKATTYTKQEVDDILDDAVEHSQALSDLAALVDTKASKEYVDGQLNLKANVTDVYDKDVMDQLLADKAHITHKHAISDVTGLQEKIAVYDTWEGRLEDVENDIDDLQADISRIDTTLTHKADLDANGKLAQWQIPDNVVTTDKLQAAIEQYVTKSLVESRLGVSFKYFVIPMSWTAATLSNDWITADSAVLWTWTEDLSGHITWKVSDSRIVVNSTETENGTFYCYLIKNVN